MTPTESPFLLSLDFEKAVKAAAKDAVKFPQISHQSRGSASPGRGEWQRTSIFAIQGTAEAKRATLIALRDNLVATAKQTGCHITVAHDDFGKAELPTFQLDYAIGQSSGTVTFRMELSTDPSDQHPSAAQQPDVSTHRLTVDIHEKAH